MANNYNTHRSPETYWAAEDRETIGDGIAHKIDQFYEYANNSGRKYIWDECHRLYNDVLTQSVDVAQLGDVGQLSEVHLNVVRNLQTHMINLTLAQRPAWDPRAINSDYKSQAQTLLAKGILDYEMKEKELEAKFRTACNYAMTYGDSAIVALWDAREGDEVTRVVLDPETGDEINETVTDEKGEPIKTGEIVYKAVPSHDLIRDTGSNNMHDLNWVIVRDYVNRYDLIAKYADVNDLDRNDFETEDEYMEFYDAIEDTRYAILGANSKSELGINFVVGEDDFAADDTDLIPVYYFLHRPSPALPKGRFVLSVCDGDVVLEDVPLPYKDVPVHFIYPGTTYNEPFGYSPVFDIIVPQKVLNSTMSTILTNQRAFGVHNVLVPTGSNFSPPQLVGDLQFIPYDPIPDAGGGGGGRPETLNLLNTPPEIFDFASRIESSMEMLMGINSVVRGNPEANLKSGAALALMASMAIQFTQEFQQSYIHALEGIGTSVINMYRTYANTPRTIAIVGKSKRQYIQQFTREDISYIDRVAVDVGSPLAKTTAGKLQIAENLMQMGMVKTPEDYLSVVTTGQLDSMMEGETAELLYVQSENEDMQNGEQPPVVVTDNHLLHIKEHKAVLASTDARKDPNVVQATLNHIQEHITMLQDPMLQQLNMLLGQPALPPQGAQGPQQAPQGPQGPEVNVGGNPDAAEVMDSQNPIEQGAEGVRSAQMPNMPTNPLTGLPFNPQTGGDPTNNIE